MNAYRLSRRESTVYIKDALDKDGGRFGDNLTQVTAHMTAHMITTPCVSAAQVLTRACTANGCVLMSPRAHPPARPRARASVLPRESLLSPRCVLRWKR